MIYFFHPPPAATSYSARMRFAPCGTPINSAVTITAPASGHSSCSNPGSANGVQLQVPRFKFPVEAIVQSPERET